MRRLSKHGKRKLNNRGMSLVEVLVAMVILSVVSIVFLRTFSYSTMLNQKAGAKQHALTLAQSLMEGFKAYDLDSINSQFAAANAADFKLYPLDGSETKGGNYTSGYWLKNIAFDESRYDVRIRLSEATPTESTVVTKATLATGEDANKYNDAIFVQDAAEQNKIYDEIIAGLTAAGMKASEIPTYATLDKTKLTITGRELKVEITANKVQVQSVYQYQVSGYEFVKDDDSLGEYNYSGSLSVSYDCYDNTATVGNNAELQKVYLYYYPAYKHSYNGVKECNSDVITINNASGTSIDVYVVKQKNSVFSDPQLVVCEGDYSVAVSGNNDTILYHNLNTTLSGTGTPTYSASGVTDKGALWVDEPDKKLIYKVEITVYKNGSTEELYKLSGTTNAR